MIEEQTRKRIQGDFTYQSEKVKNLLRAIYRDPVLAWEQWSRQIERQGFEAFKRNLSHGLQTLGRMNGRFAVAIDTLAARFVEPDPSFDQEAIQALRSLVAEIAIRPAKKTGALVEVTGHLSALVGENIQEVGGRW